VRKERFVVSGLRSVSWALSAVIPDHSFRYFYSEIWLHLPDQPYLMKQFFPPHSALRSGNKNDPPNGGSFHFKKKSRGLGGTTIFLSQNALIPGSLSATCCVRCDGGGVWPFL
jgi:hypothetical protein